MLKCGVKQGENNSFLTCPYGKLGIWTSFSSIPDKLTKAEGIANTPRAPLRSTKFKNDQIPVPSTHLVSKCTTTIQKNDNCCLTYIQHIREERSNTSPVNWLFYEHDEYMGWKLMAASMQNNENWKIYEAQTNYYIRRTSDTHLSPYCMNKKTAYWESNKTSNRWTKSI